MKNSNLQAWILASRPKTLLAAVVPVLVGSSLAASHGAFRFWASLVALFCSVMIQIGTNFTNDLYDAIRGADTDERVGPVRAIHSGMISKSTMRKAVFLTFGSSFIAGLLLVYLGGWPIFIMGVLSIISGIIYTAGPFPLAYNGLGDIFSFVFFGVVGTVGTYFINTLQWSADAFLVSLPVGALITAILVVNNYRDIDQDAKAGKRTLIVIFGRKFALAEYLFLFLLAFATPAFMYFAPNRFYSPWILLPITTLPMAVYLFRQMLILKGTELNMVLEYTAKFSALFGALFSIGLLL